MVIVHNMRASNALRHNSAVVGQKAKNTERVSSGYKINRAGDDAAGLAISETMRKQIRGLSQGTINVKDGIGLIQVTDGALSDVSDILQRINELSVQAATGTKSESDRRDMQQEIEGLKEEVSRIADTTRYNELYVFRKGAFVASAGGAGGAGGAGSSEQEKAVVECKAATTGYLTESYEIDSLYYPAAVMDFRKVTAETIATLDGKKFSFSCSMGCAEAFTFEFSMTKPSSAADLTNQYDNHRYTINIADCTSGGDVVDALYDFVKSNPPTHSAMPLPKDVPIGIAASHANAIHKDGTKLVLYAMGRGCSLEEEAIHVFDENVEIQSPYAKVDIAELTGIKPGETVEEEDTDEEKDATPLLIQCSSNVEDYIPIYLQEMNNKVLGIDEVKATTVEDALLAIDSVAAAINQVSAHRSRLGAGQNRLEHALNANQNTEENTQVSESTIRDTDMAETMVDYSSEAVIEQAGVSVLSQAVHSVQNVLNLIH